MARETTVPPAIGGIVASVGGTALFTLIASFADAAYARGGVPSPRLLVADWALCAPLGFALGLVGAVLRVLFFPREFSLVRPVFPRRELSLEARRARLLLGLASGVAALCFVVFVARAALRLLASPAEAVASGAAIAVATLGLAGLAAVFVLGIRSLLPADGEVVRFDLMVAGVGAGVFVLGLGSLVMLGETSGAPGVLDVFGVFRRKELDLRPPTLALLILCGSVALAPVGGLAKRAGMLALAVGPLALTLLAARPAFDPVTTLAIERGAPLGKLLIKPARRIADVDGDGASSAFGGGDCDEGNPRVNPAADDVPGNRIDEDCSGSDASAAPKPAAEPSAADVAASESARKKLPEKPNVVLITIDALRADVGYMGYPRKITPNIDALAARSAIFENAYALASYTSKSLGPMLIGRYGSETHRGFLHFNRFTREDTFVSERMQKAGVRTLSVQGHWYFFKNYGFERGFDVIDTKATPPDQPVEGDRTVNGDVLSDRIIAQLDAPELTDKQFFLWSHYIDAHADYIPHEGFDFGPRKARDLYDGEVAFVDHHLGRVLAALEKKPFASRTVVIITSDHGEAFGEHNFWRHGFELWEVLVRVPLVVYVPGAEPRRIKERRSLIDIAPTLLELVSVPAPARDAKDALRGKSLLPDVLGPKGAPREARPIYMDMSAGPYNDERQGYIEGDLKLVTSGGRPLNLFDLAKDPAENHDLLEDREKLRPMLEKSKAFRRSLDEVVYRK
jgi:choline-sulfatase